ncbi:hypothetical protein BBJ28_00003221 [Nothophytophthora sp. Chile5]|nr:hypothetical protein BBJ28_00003221 [Nothophytophthora sp. Chile5]
MRAFCCFLALVDQGVQVDFDDGHCPTWNNTLHGHFNILEATRGALALPGVKLVEKPALLVVRPRAWNMDEPGSIKATVLIENIFAAFEMDEILFELRHHSSGLNCGMWDYTASIVVNFRHRSDFVLPDRQQYVSMKSDFLKYYMELLIRTCKRRSAPATTGMVPFVLSELPAELSQAEAIAKAQAGKRMEALAGSDGALVYDLALVKPVQEVFTSARSSASLTVTAIDEAFYKESLLIVPRGNVTRRSVEANVRVALLYVLHWLYGQGTVVVNGCVEDSATAEISRAQLWQWVHHQVPIAASFERVNAEYVNLCCCPSRDWFRGYCGRS